MSESGLQQSRACLLVSPADPCTEKVSSLPAKQRSEPGQSCGRVTPFRHCRQFSYPPGLLPLSHHGPLLFCTAPLSLIMGANVCSHGESEGELSYSCHLLVKTKMFYFSLSKLETKLATESFWHNNAHLLCGAHLRKAAGSFCSTSAH